MMSGTEFLDDFLQPFCFKPKAEGSAVAKPRPMNLVSRNLLIAKKDPPQDSSDPNSYKESRIGSELCFIQRQVTDAETSTKTQQMCSQERQDKMTLNLPAPGNWGGEMNLQAQPAPANWSEVRTSKSEGQRWNSTMC